MNNIGDSSTATQHLLAVIAALPNELKATILKELQPQPEAPLPPLPNSPPKAIIPTDSQKNEDARTTIPRYLEDEKFAAIEQYLRSKNYRQASKNLRSMFPDQKHKKFDEKSISYWVKQYPEKVNEIRASLKSKNKLAKVQIRADQSHFPDMEKELVSFIEEERKSHKILTRKAICDKAIELCIDPLFKGSVGWFYKFCKRHGIVKRARTHAMKKLRDGIFTSVVEHLEKLRSYRIECMKSSTEELSIVFCNADEVPIQVDTYGYTYDFRGKSEISCRAPAAGRMRFTVMLAVLSTGVTLPPLFIIKPSSILDQLQEKFKGVALVASSPNAWMNTHLATQWLNKVWSPLHKDENIKKVLVWDKFSAHKTSSVESIAKGIGEVEYVPAGCTDLIQPLDTHLNRVVKSTFREAYTKWVNEQGGSDAASSGTLKLPSFELLIEWVLLGVLRLKEETIKKSFDFCGKSAKLFSLIHVLRYHCLFR